MLASCRGRPSTILNPTRVGPSDFGSTCAIDIPQWNFHWQQFYYYQQPILVGPGDIVRLECTYDNSADNQPIINGVRAQPAPLMWGEATTDEMCLNYLYFTSI